MGSIRILTARVLATASICCCADVPLTAATHEVGPGMPVIIPITEVIGGTDARNNAKNNPNGGYFSVYDTISEFNYPNTHANQLGSTAMVNDHTYWDSAPGGLDATHAPHPDPGGGNALWWPVPGEWVALPFTVSVPGTYAVLTRFSSSGGPSQPAQVTMTIDGQGGGSIALVPDDAKLWADTHYQVGGWWGHTMVSGTCPIAWTLGVGPHVVKMQVTQVAGNPKDHGNLWIHYLKIMAAASAPKPPSTIVKAVEPRQLATANAAYKKAAEAEQKGKSGQALVAYEKAQASAPPGSELLDHAAAKAKELRAKGDALLAAAKALTGAEAQAAFAKLADEFAGSDIGAAAKAGILSR